MKISPELLMIKFPRNADDKYFPEIADDKNFPEIADDKNFPKIADGLGTSIQHHEMVAIFSHFCGAEWHWTNRCCQRVV